MQESYPFQLRDPEEAAREREPQLHVFGDGVICDTDTRGYAEPGNRLPTEIVVDATEGFIPLWARGVTLRWRFQEHSISLFENRAAAEAAIKELLAKALLAWGDATPIRFTQRDDAWDFEIVVRQTDRCEPDGRCVLASAFFPDGGRHELRIYPRMFTQSPKEQVDTLIHEIGHTFGLRHFFANISETRWRSEIFGTHRPFSIMNYGSQSELTDDDKSDLKRLYQMVWSGQLTQINGTPIQFVEPFHILNPESLVALDRTLVMSGASGYGEPEYAVRGESVTPRVSRRVGAASGADRRSGIAPATADEQPGLPPDPPREPIGNTEVIP